MMLGLSVPMLKIVSFVYDICNPLRGTNVLTQSDERLALADVTDGNYTTVHSISSQLEPDGVNNLFYVYVYLDWYVSGKGSMRWQISGDGGDTWVTVTEDIDFNEVGLTNYFRYGSGEWITSVSNGDNKLQLRFQVKASEGTISSEIVDSSFLAILNRLTIRGL